MPTIREMIEFLMPNGTNGTSGNWKTVPLWPPDLFAVVASLVDQSSCFTHSRFSSNDVFSAKFFQELPSLVKTYSFRPDNSGTVEDQRVRWLDGIINSPAMSWWKELYEQHRNCPVDRLRMDDNALPGWWDAAIKLLVLADQSSCGVGFIYDSDDDDEHSWFPNSIYQQFISYHTRRSSRPPNETSSSIRADHPATSIQFPSSLCIHVPSCKVCVQPKTHTVQTGCTINNLTHHLSFLPAHSKVQTEWIFALSDHDHERLKSLADKPLPKHNVLLIPFPYSISPDCFIAGGKASYHPDDPAHFFSLSQQWLRNGPVPLTAKDIANDLVIPLIQQTKKMYDEDVEWVIFPELALTHDLARGVADLLAQSTQVHLFISGVLSNNPDGVPKNEVYTAVLKPASSDCGVRLYESLQSKHHRWRLEKAQLEKYGLTSVLPSDKHWWEQIDIEKRKCTFWLLDNQASFAMLICEDLARVEPIQSVLRAVGPNMLIALLMDDEQLEYRWSSRYATALADDPGTGCLTLTSLGLIHRAASVSKTSKVSYSIGIWREGTATHPDPVTNPPPKWKGLLGRSWPIELVVGDHAQLIQLQGKQLTTFTFDGRSDDNFAVRMHLLSSKGVRCEQLPDWIRYPVFE